MKFWEAMKAMQEGKTVTCESSRDNGVEYEYFDGEYFRDQDGDALDFNESDVLDETWEIYNKKDKIIDQVMDLLKQL